MAWLEAEVRDAQDKDKGDVRREATDASLQVVAMEEHPGASVEMYVDVWLVAGRSNKRLSMVMSVNCTIPVDCL